MMIELLNAGGHEARGFIAGGDLLAALAPDTELVLADAVMKEMDGFALAEQVAAKVGNCPPRTVLLSTDTHHDRMRAASVKSVLGIIAEPFAIAEFDKIIKVMQATRDSCPCRLKGLIDCPEMRANAETAAPEKIASYCGSGNYANCPEYATLCGERLREWIARAKH